MIEVENQSHRSGDHQTLKSTKQVRHQAMRLIKSDVAPQCDVLKVKKDIIHWFNNQAFIEFFAKYDIEMTDALKQGINTELASFVNSEMALRLEYTQRPIDLNVWDFKCNTDFKYSAIEPQMETEATAFYEKPVEANQPGVVLLKKEPVKTKFYQGFERLACSSIAQTYEDMDDDWINAGVGIWAATDVVNKKVFSLKLPHELIAKHKDSPLCQLFMTHMYFRYDSIRVKIEYNSNPFQIGQLMASFFYGAKVTYNEHQNVYSAIQRQCVPISAGQSLIGSILSTSVQFIIPYHFHDSAQSMIGSHMGDLEVFVLNPLASAGNIVNVVNFTVFVAIDKPRFYGSVSRRVLTSQVDGIEDD